ncbi:MAG: hypothetical protein V4459_10380 [Pseudomonadota bacterium]
MAAAYHGTLYTGVTWNLIGRVMQHRHGTHDGFTKTYGIKRRFITTRARRWRP